MELQDMLIDESAAKEIADSLKSFTTKELNDMAEMLERFSISIMTRQFAVEDELHRRLEASFEKS